MQPDPFNLATPQNTQAPTQLNPNKVDSQARGHMQQGMYPAQSMVKAANNPSNQFFARGGKVRRMSKEDSKNELELSSGMNNDKQSILDALSDAKTKYLLKNIDNIDSEQDTAPIPAKKPIPETDVDNKNNAKLSIPYTTKSSDVYKILDEVIPKKNKMKCGGLTKYASGGGVPPGALKKEVADNVPAMLSDGEFVFSADATRFWGLRCLMGMVEHAREELAELSEKGGIDTEYNEDVGSTGLMGKFHQDSEPDLTTYDDKEFGPDYNKGGLSMDLGGVIGTDISYARGGLLKNIKQ